MIHHLMTDGTARIDRGRIEMETNKDFKHKQTASNRPRKGRTTAWRMKTKVAGRMRRYRCLDINHNLGQLS
jgi:hypothetical protein